MNPSRRPIEWTPDKIKILCDYYPTMFNTVMAKWLGVSYRTLERKARALGLVKVANFNELKAESFSQIVSDGVKRAYAEGRKVSHFKKGVRNNPQGEFPKGHKFDDAIEEERKEKIRRTYRKKKILKIYGLK